QLARVLAFYSQSAVHERESCRSALHRAEDVEALRRQFLTARMPESRRLHRMPLLVPGVRPRVGRNERALPDLFIELLGIFGGAEAPELVQHEKIVPDMGFQEIVLLLAPDVPRELDERALR